MLAKSIEHTDSVAHGYAKDKKKLLSCDTRVSNLNNNLVTGSIIRD
jgi:hypothetical protein